MAARAPGMIAAGNQVWRRGRYCHVGDVRRIDGRPKQEQRPDDLYELTLYDPIQKERFTITARRDQKLRTIH